ncbi:MAG: hypothetical protein QXE01_07145 [Sulfolobales archaeon]
MPLHSEEFWQGCRVIESIICIGLGDSRYSYCSPLGLRRENESLVLRVYEDGLMVKLLDVVRSSRLYICRDPYIIYRALSEHFMGSDDKDLMDGCGVIADIHINIFRDGDGYRDYLVDVISYLKIEPQDPRLIARICRSENLFVEAMIMSTREDLVVRGPSKMVEDFCIQYRYAMGNAKRLSRRNEVLEALSRLAMRICS